MQLFKLFICTKCRSLHKYSLLEVELKTKHHKQAHATTNLCYGEVKK